MKWWKRSGAGRGGGTLVGMDRCLAIPNDVKELNMGKETGRMFLTADLNVKISCAKMVPNNLS